MPFVSFLPVWYTGLDDDYVVICVLTVSVPAERSFVFPFHVIGTFFADTHGFPPVHLDDVEPAGAIVSAIITAVFFVCPFRCHASLLSIPKNICKIHERRPACCNCKTTEKQPGVCDQHVSQGDECHRQRNDRPKHQRLPDHTCCPSTRHRSGCDRDNTQRLRV